MDEIFTCPRCNAEFDLQAKNDEIVSQTKCKCIIKQTLINGKKPLDYAIGVLNESIKPSSSKVSKPVKTSSKRL